MRFLNYHPPMKFQECNVLSRGCLSVHGGLHFTIMHNDIGHPHHTRTCFQLFNLNPTLHGRGPSPPDMVKLVHYEMLTVVGEWVVDIRLKCLLVVRLMIWLVEIDN